ncbi:uncharacterized protein BJ171DRAFT_553054 [Polychytrium aggregatum]|uniref:uncharacterized protein n=1 Tax=Polychytrium aggregatum TaxID=110093 RepID=UPI0022FEFA85|nr:uncharacterized protein BJ171DRAFT_553054 [Polychytrium aggregatum]KAI9183775.1 hypothetical protein BJ171DRAFT_553054 [Polychytrium aggregatum]
MVTRKDHGISIFKDGNRRFAENLDFAREQTHLLLSDIRTHFSATTALPFVSEAVDTLRSLLDHTSGELADGDLLLNEQQVIALHSAVITLHRDELPDEEQDISCFLQYTKHCIVNGVSASKSQAPAETPVGSTPRFFARHSTPLRLKRKSPPRQSPEPAAEGARASPSFPPRSRRRLSSPDVSIEVVIETTEQPSTTVKIEDRMIMLRLKNLWLQNELLRERIKTERVLREEKVAAIRRGDPTTSSY